METVNQDQKQETFPSEQEKSCPILTEEDRELIKQLGGECEKCTND